MARRRRKNGLKMEWIVIGILGYLMVSNGKSKPRPKPISDTFGNPIADNITGNIK